jgi:hypothetical protein
MSISVEHLPNLSNIKLEYKKNKYPLSPDPNLAKMYFVSLFVGSRGSGKTYSACQLLKLYEQYGLYQHGHKMDQRIVLISPTQSANRVYTSLKNLDEKDIFENYSDSLLLNILDDFKNEKKETEEYLRKLKIWKRFIKLKKIEDLEPHELIELELMGYNEPKKCRFPNGVVNFLILDDLIGSTAFKSTGQSALTNLVLKNRHLSVNILIMTQNLKAIPKSIRTNTSVFVIYRFASKKIIVEDLYEEVSNSLTLDKFEELFDFATTGEHNALIIDFTQPKENRFKKNWGDILRIQ